MPSAVRRRLAVLLLALVTPAVALIAQDTPTEKAAAKDVVRQMEDAQQKLAVPALVAKLTGPNAARDAVAARAKELMDKELLAMADDITRHPEVGF